MPEAIRRLATIMMADIEGYSRLMGAAERDTHVRVSRLQKELIEPTIKEHRGTLVQVTGDGFMSVFDSPVECVRCAIVIQQSMVGQNLELAREYQIRFRIGINLGDVIVDGDEVHGDGVNVAARLENEAAAGTINISASVYEQVRHKLVCGYQSLGDKRLKNIQDPVLVYRVLPDPASVIQATRKFSARVGVLAAACLLLLFAAGAYAWQRLIHPPAAPVALIRAPVITNPPPEPANPRIQEAVARVSPSPPTVPTVINDPGPPDPNPRTALVVPPPSPKPAPPSVHAPEMVSIPGGSFQMGSNDDPTERPVHRVTVPPFLIGRHLVTLGQWRECARASSCREAPAGGDDEPMGNVSWNDAQQYVMWLAQMTKQPYRLPTEAEWELAVRAGTDTKYWWGNVMKANVAICKGCGELKRPQKVGTLPANPYGVFDINGGMSEWVADCWARDYMGAPADGTARVTPDCRDRVLRGASWTNDASYARSAARDFYDASVRYPTHGFRVAQSR